MSAAVAALKSVEDYLALPELPIVHVPDAASEGFCYRVLEVGMYRATEEECDRAGLAADWDPAMRCFGLPTVTILCAKDIKRFRLPLSMAEWAGRMVVQAQINRTLFPAKIEFGLRWDCYFAELR
jgi:hypothetical protein